MTDGDRDATSRIRRQLRAQPFARGLGERHVDALAAMAEPVSFVSGETIFEAGGPADRFYLVLTGVVTLEVRRGSGPTRPIQSIHEGSALGWSWLFEPYEWEFDARADTPVRAIAIDAAALRARFDEDAELGYRVLMRVARVMAQRLHATRREVLELARP